MGGPGSGAKPKIYPTELVNAVRARYVAGASQEEVAAALGISQKVVWNLMRRHGIPRRPQAKRDQFGPNNASWKGDEANYQTSHARVSRVRGAPQHCEQCGTNDPSRSYEWANLTGNYPDVNDYRRMCRPCHREFDGPRLRDAKGRWLPRGVMPDA